MLESLETIFAAALSGSLELFLLCTTGAILWQRRIFNRAVCRSLSRAIVNAFLPSLLFLSIVRTLYSLREVQNATLIILTPIFLSLFTQTLGVLLGLIIVRFFGRDLEPMVQRACVLCVGFGNSNTLPILMIRALCETFEPLSESAGSVALCKQRGTGFCSLFLIVWSIAFWSLGMRYLIGSEPPSQPDSELVSRDDDCEEQTLGCTSAGEVEDEQHSLVKQNAEPPPKIPGLLTSPVIAIILALVIGHISPISDVIVASHAPAESFRLTLRLLGSIVIPLSPMIIGARLYAHFRNPMDRSVGKKVVAAVLVGRLVLLPMIGLLCYLLVRSKLPSDDPLLHLVLLAEMNTPTANNTMICAQIATIFRPKSADAVEATIATLIFWQYLVLPILLTANTAIFLKTVFGTTAEVSMRSLAMLSLVRS